MPRLGRTVEPADVLRLPAAPQQVAIELDRLVRFSLDSRPLVVQLDPSGRRVRLDP